MATVLSAALGRLAPVRDAGLRTQRGCAPTLSSRQLKRGPTRGCPPSWGHGASSSATARRHTEMCPGTTRQRSWLVSSAFLDRCSPVHTPMRCHLAIPQDDGDVPRSSSEHSAHRAGLLAYYSCFRSRRSLLLPAPRAPFLSPASSPDVACCGQRARCGSSCSRYLGWSSRRRARQSGSCIPCT